MPQLYYNGNILTMDESCPRVQAVLVDGGRIRERGTDARLLSSKSEDTVCIDLQGKTMLPGFLDGHSHFAGFATSLAQCDLSRALSFDDIVEKLQAFIRENAVPAGQWVVGVNYDHNFLPEKTHPDRRLLDKISHPVLIIHASSHMGVTNSEGLKIQGLDDSAADPPGGRYGRKNGVLTGYMEENAFVAFRSAMPMPEPEAILDLFGRAQQIYASYGITTVQEGMVTEALLPLLKLAAERGKLYLDLVGYQDLENCGVPEAGGYRGHLRMGGCKIFLDGSPQGRTAWMLEPYEGSGDRGYPIKTDEALYGLILTALQNRSQLLAHCNGDAAAEQFITQFEKVLRDHPRLDPCRPVMVHAQLVRRSQLERMKKISMIPSFFVAHTYYWGDIHAENFGMDRAGRISPAGTALKLGLPFTFHQDSPVLPPDVFTTIWCAVRRVTQKGVALDRGECIDVYEGLKAQTINAAIQYGEEADKGSIAQGKLADLIVLDRDPLSVPPDAVKDIRVLETIKEGVSVYRR